MKLTNRSDGPRGINTTEGLVVLPRGATWEGKLAKGELKTLEKSWFERDAEDDTSEDEDPDAEADEGDEGDETNTEGDETPTGGSKSRRNRR